VRVGRASLLQGEKETEAVVSFVFIPLNYSSFCLAVPSETAARNRYPAEVHS
jgi:hypothetical protein